MNDQERRNKPLFSMAVVMELTELTARQIRYYEQNELINPVRTKGNHRLFSFNDIDRLLEIKSLLEKGINLAGIKEIFKQKEVFNLSNVSIKKNNAKETLISDAELLKFIKSQIVQTENYGKSNSLFKGDFSRFFIN